MLFIIYNLQTNIIYNLQTINNNIAVSMHDVFSIYIYI